MKIAFYISNCGYEFSPPPLKKIICFIAVNQEYN